ncbi:hypothetical protein NDK43_08070 [Neobacillus pocheonensis]|uniref:Uncharacterized protein n=1 Tax=Neobacillus pocheonensis TaxID=363869 RepID=A0ABT0W8M5_9BACI|nr:hypothetical protein [Neobacillus pocheonensis]
MNFGEIQLCINDYLDLYLFAKSMNDPLWQQEIIEKLKTSQKGETKSQGIQFFESNCLLDKNKQN